MNIKQHLIEKNLLISNILNMRAKILDTSVDNIDSVSRYILESKTIDELREIQNNMHIIQ